MTFRRTLAGQFDVGAKLVGNLALNSSVDSVSGGCRVMLVEVRRCGVYSQMNGARAPKRSIPILETGGRHGVIIG